MIIFFAFLAGFLTILAPCVLPVLPIVLAGGTDRGRGRPLGLGIGIVLSFSLITLGLSWAVQQFGLSPEAGRLFGIIVLIILGVVMLVPNLFATLESKVQSFFARRIPKNHHEGFIGGLVLGIALGAVWAPCVGPILGSVVAAAQNTDLNFGIIITTIAYAIGAAVPLTLIAFFGQRLRQQIRFLNRYSGRIQSIFGLLLILVAVGMIYNLDREFQAWFLSTKPNWVPLLQACENLAPLQK